MTATKTADGKWAVMNGSDLLAGPFETSAEAWRWIDRHEGEPISKGESTAQWLWDKTARAE